MKPRFFLILSCILLWACGSAIPAERPENLSSETGADEETVDCSELTEASCLESSACTLAPDGEASGGYRCREAVPPCETGFKQGVHGAEDCTSKEGCVFEPARCYCPPDVVCICGGGPPPRCVAAGETEAPSG